MIKIHPKMWYIINPSREDDLAYMTHYAEDSAFENRKSTGTDWAKPSNQKWNPETKKYEHIEIQLPVGQVIDNSPVKGIYIGSSVSRWSTSNKLFRVKDPRGFTVEVPTDNIATLLHLTTVINGVVQEECVWGREGSNHIILPVNSEPYLETLDKMDIVANKLIKPKDLKPGDWVEVFENKTEHLYIGKVKFKWQVTPYTPGNYYRYGNNNGSPTVYGEPTKVEDTKWVDLFVYPQGRDKKGYFCSKTGSVKVVKVIKNEPSVHIKSLGYVSFPERVRNTLNQEYNYKNTVIGYTEKHSGKYIELTED